MYYNCQDLELVVFLPGPDGGFAGTEARMLNWAQCRLPAYSGGQVRYIYIYIERERERERERHTYIHTYRQTDR